MIPGKYICPSGWTREYYGYLMSERYNHHRSTFECMDLSTETIAGGHTNQNGALFHDCSDSVHAANIHRVHVCTLPSV